MPNSSGTRRRRRRTVPPLDQDSALAPRIPPKMSREEASPSAMRGAGPCSLATNKRSCVDERPSYAHGPPRVDSVDGSSPSEAPTLANGPSHTVRPFRASKGPSRANGQSHANNGQSRIGRPSRATKRSPRATKRSSRAGAGALDSGDSMSDFEHVRRDDAFDAPTIPSISPTPSPISPSASSVSPTPSHSPTTSSESLVSLIDYSSDSSFSIIVSDDLSSEYRTSSGEQSPSPSEPAPSPSEPTPLHSEDRSSQNATLPLSTSMWRWRPTTASDEDSPPSNSHHNLTDRCGDFASDHDDRSSSHHNLSSTDLSSTNLANTRIALSSTRIALSSNRHDALGINPTDLSSSFSAAFARLSLEDDASDAQAVSYAQAVFGAQAASNARPKRRREPVARPYLTTSSFKAINKWLRTLERSPPLAPSECSPAPSEFSPAPSEHAPASSEHPEGASSLLWQAESSVPRRQATPSELSRIDVSRRRLSALRQAAPWRDVPLDI